MKVLCAIAVLIAGHIQKADSVPAPVPLNIPAIKFCMPDYVYAPLEVPVITLCKPVPDCGNMIAPSYPYAQRCSINL